MKDQRKSKKLFKNVLQKDPKGLVQKYHFTQIQREFKGVKEKPGVQKFEYLSFHSVGS